MHGFISPYSEMKNGILNLSLNVHTLIGGRIMEKMSLLGGKKSRTKKLDRKSNKLFERIDSLYK